MSLPTREVLGILADNLGKRNSVIPLPRRKSTDWSQGLGIPRGGDTILYTGLMYQLMPSINALQRMAMRFEDSWISRFARVARTMNRFASIASLVTMGRRHEQESFYNLLRNTTCLLRKAGLEFGYLYEDELYTGALIHDLGMCDAFERHARKVYKLLRNYGVKRILTVDPHTTNMLRSVYPTVLENYRVEVKSYLEVLAERTPELRQELYHDVVIHDSCVNARYENIVDEPRFLLEKAGLNLTEPEYSGKMTYCCGGPIESLFPGKALAIAANRIDQLARKGRNIVTMCPICFVNLAHAAEGKNVSVKDISQYLVEAYCGDARH